MSKTLTGVVVSVKMGSAAVVEVTRKVPHPKYRKLQKRSKKFSVALNGKHVKLGDTVSIAETRPISKTVHFVISKTQNKEAKS